MSTRAQSWRSERLGRAVAAIEADRPAEAERRCRALLAADPADGDARLLLGLAQGLDGNPSAARHLDVAYRASPANDHPCHSLAELLRRHARPEAVAGALACSLALAPEADGLRLELAELRREAGEAEAALDLLAPLLARGCVGARAGLLAGIALADLGDTEAAIGWFRAALEAEPGNAAAWSNLGLLLKIEGRFDAAIAAADRAVALAPDDPQIRLNRAIALLRGGRMAEAWADYDARLRLPGRALLPEALMLPVVSSLPADALRGRSVLLTHEEGFGDSLQFLRYAPLLAARGMRVVVWAPAPLVRLLRGVDGIDAVVQAGDALPATDHHCPVFSLPRVFETTLDSIPPPLAYRADPALVEGWRGRLPAGRRIGLVWAGQARPWLPGFALLDRRRSLGLAALAPLGGVAGVNWVSLQMGEPAAQAADAPFALVDPMGKVADFADTAAIIANLDAVVSVDTSVVHLAASMGKPVLLLDRYDNCWRWLAGREDSPWYPGLRIFRQPGFGDWVSAIARVVDALAVDVGNLPT